MAFLSHLIVSFVMLSLTGGQWLPLLAPSLDDALPACCRAKGGHHCDIKAVVAPEQGSGVRLAASKCRFYPAQAYASQGHTAIGITSAEAYFCELVSHPSTHAQADACFRIAFDRTRQKRGPPSLSLA